MSDTKEPAWEKINKILFPQFMSHPGMDNVQPVRTTLRRFCASSEALAMMGLVRLDVYNNTVENVYLKVDQLQAKDARIKELKDSQQLMESQWHMAEEEITKLRRRCEELEKCRSVLKAALQSFESSGKLDSPTHWSHRARAVLLSTPSKSEKRGGGTRDMTYYRRPPTEKGATEETIIFKIKRCGVVMGFIDNVNSSFCSEDNYWWPKDIEWWAYVYLPTEETEGAK